MYLKNNYKIDYFFIVCHLPIYRWMTVANEELIPYGFKIPKSNSDKIKAYAEKRQVKYSVILNEAVSEYIDRRENPNSLAEQIERVLIARPELLDQPLRIIAARNLSK